MKTLSLPALAVALLAGAPFAEAHPGHETTDSLVFSLFTAAARSSGGAMTNQVSITVEGDTRIVRSNGIPDHRTGQFPNRGNPNSISPQDYEFRMTTQPRAAEQPRFAGGAWFGVALNGVPFEPGTAEFWKGERQWNYEALSGAINLGIDQSNAHVQPTGAYHYHALPTGMLASRGGDGTKMQQVGWAADGFPIYSAYGAGDTKDATSPLKKLTSSWKVRKGARNSGPGGQYDGTFTADFEYVAGSGDLDECNGRFEVTPEFPEGTYAYHITEEFPWISRYWKGTPDASFYKQMGPGGGPGGQGGPGMNGGQGQGGQAGQGGQFGRGGPGGPGGQGGRGGPQGPRRGRPQGGGPGSGPPPPFGPPGGLPF